MFKKILLLLLVIIILTFNNSFALTPQEQEQIINQQRIIQQQQEQQRQQEINQQQIDEAERIRKTRSGIVGGSEDDDLNSIEELLDSGADGSVCKRDFRLIKVEGNKTFSVEELKKKVLGKYLKKCMNKKNIQAMQNELTKFYFDRGYSNARIYFDFKTKKKHFKELKDGIFYIVIEEGVVNDIILVDTRYNNKLEKKKLKLMEQQKETEQQEKKEGKNKKKQKENNFQFSTFNFQLSAFQSFRLKSQAFFAFPFLKGKVFNLRDYEQGLDQLNRLQSNNATMDIRAVDEAKNNHYPFIGESNEQSSFGGGQNNNLNKRNVNNNQPASSDIYIINNNTFPIHLNASIDNSGSKTTGENLANISLSFDNLISINDNIYLKYTQDTDTENSKRFNKVLYSSLSIPFGYWTLSSSLNYSKYFTTIEGYTTSFHTRGNTLTQTYDLDRVLFRTQLYKINAGANLTIRDTESWVRDLKSQTGSRKSSNINIYLNNTIYTRLGTIILKPSYQKGLKLFHSKKDESHSSMLKTEPRLQYDLIKFYAYYNTRLNLPLLTKTQVIDPETNQPMMVKKEIKNKNNKNKETELVPLKARNKINLNYTLTFDSQYSWNTLYGTDQFSIGGEYTIRGFRNENISGDNGYYIRNDLSVSLQQLFPKILINTKFMNYGSTIKGKNTRLSINDALSRTYLGIFYDYGYTKDKYSDSSDKQYNSQSGYMSGTGIALNYYGKYLNWSLTYAKALRSPQYLQTRDGIKKENHSLYWRIGGRF